MASFIRKVPTASGARAVQIVHKQGRQVVGIEHIGSAHDDGQLAVLMEVARARLLPGQDSFDLTSPSATSSTSSGAGAGAQVAGMSSRLLWDVLAGAYQRLGFAAVADGQILESARAMGTGKAARPRRVIYQYKFARYSHDNRAINAMVARAEKITTGATPMAKARFVKVTGATKELDQGLIDRARQLAGLKGYVTNLPATTMDGQG